MERRSFLKLSCGLGAGILLSSLGVSVLPIEAFAQELTKYDRIKTAKQSTSICCYCAVGCGLLCSTDTKTGKIINIEGDPEHPINEARCAPRGAASTRPRPPTTAAWTRCCTARPTATSGRKRIGISPSIASRGTSRKSVTPGFVKKNAKGQTVNRVESVAHLGSSNVDSEECWSMAVFARSYGLVYIDHQARV